MERRKCISWNNGNPCMHQRAISCASRGKNSLKCNKECPYFKRKNEDVKRIKTPTVIMYAIRKVFKNVPDLSSLTYWREQLILAKNEEVVKVIFEPLRRKK